MGEVKIKSGNLFDLKDYITKAAYVHNIEITLILNGISIIATSSDDPYINPSYNVVGQQITASTVKRAVINCKPNTAYTLSLHQSQNVSKRISYFNSEFTVIKSYDSFNGTIFNMITPENCAYILIRIGDSATLSEGTMVELTNIQLLEGTYTSETIPEYQPYFLNRPAHQFVNGQWVDIPTHHYTNGRWQGELTSQSPLKFWADGEMLDWRVEGRTSGNLFDGTLIPTTTLGVTFRLDNNGYMYASPTNSDTRGWTYANSQIKVTLPSGNYTLCLSGTPSTSVNSGIRVNDDANKNLAYKGAINGQSTVIINFAVTDNHNIGIVAKIHDGRFRVQILKGTYTTQTIPPYEPYGGVGDWDETAQRYKIPVTVNGITTNLFTDHQLLDGDSIDYTTDQTAIPLATGNNTLTVDTAVQPSKVFIKFEG